MTMRVARVEACDAKQRILAVYANESVYVGRGREFVNLSTGQTLCTHDKSVRNASGCSRFIGCCSYDGTACVFDRATDRLIERIEGPETEIKCIAFEGSGDTIAISTRGKTVWILDNMEISRILEEHTQDVKGVAFYEGRLYSWSYDNTVKMFGYFEDDSSWELLQSIELDDIVWKVLLFGDRLCALTQSGRLAVLEMVNNQWKQTDGMALSVYPIVTACVAGDSLAVICNRNWLVLLDGQFRVTQEVELARDVTGVEGEAAVEDVRSGASTAQPDGRRAKSTADVLCCCYSEQLGEIVCGAEDGMLYRVSLSTECAE